MRNELRIFSLVQSFYHYIQFFVNFAEAFANKILKKIVSFVKGSFYYTTVIDKICSSCSEELPRQQWLEIATTFTDSSMMMNT